MKRPEGFDPGSLPVPERPAPPREDRAASDTDASAGGGATPGDATPGRAPSGRAPSDGARSLLTGATGQRLGAGITALAGRFRALSPDEDFVDPVAQERAAARPAAVVVWWSARRSVGSRGGAATGVQRG